MIYEDLTRRILSACFDVSNELGSGFLEAVYERALLIALTEKGIKAKNQVPLKVLFRKEIVGEYYADILVEDTVILDPS